MEDRRRARPATADDDMPDAPPSTPPIIQAALRGDEEEVKRLLADGAGAKDADLLPAAARFCSLQLVEHVVEATPAAGLQAHLLQRAACAAAEGGRLETVQRLLALLDERPEKEAPARPGAAAAAPTGPREHPHVLYYAALGGSLPVLKYLLEERGAARWQHSVPTSGRRGRGPPSDAERAILSAPTCFLDEIGPLASSDALEAVLAAHGQKTPLSAAAWRGHTDALRLLAEAGARDPAAFRAAAVHGRLNACRLLASLEGPAPDTKDLARVCAALGQLDTLRYLVEELGADPGGPEAALWAAGGGSAGCLRYLAARGVPSPPRPAPVRLIGLGPLLRPPLTGRAGEGGRVSRWDRKDPFEEAPASPLQAAAAGCHAEALRALRELDPRPSRPAATRRSSAPPAPRPRARPRPPRPPPRGRPVRARARRPRAAREPSSPSDGRPHRTLLELGAGVGDPALLDPSRPVRDRTLRTPLHAACSTAQPHIGVIRALVEAGSDLGALDRDGRAPLHVAAASASIDALRALLDGGADPSAPAEDGATALHAAAGALDLAAARLLLERGADANARDLRGAAPLHRCAEALEGQARALSGLSDRQVGDAEEARRGPSSPPSTRSSPAAPTSTDGAGGGGGAGAQGGAARRQAAPREGADPNAGPRTARPLAAAARKSREDAAVVEVPAPPRRPLKSLAAPLTGARAEGAAGRGASSDCVGESPFGRDFPPLPPVALARGPALGVLLKREGERLSAPGAERPRVERVAGPNPFFDKEQDPELLVGAAAGFFMAAFSSAVEGEESLAGLAMDLMLCCEGRLRARDFLLDHPKVGGILSSKEEAARLWRGAMRLAALEGRLEGAVPGGGPAGPGPDPPEALREACRLGLRVTALRLARAGGLSGADGEGRTALELAIGAGPAMLDVCGALFERGAELTSRALDATRDGALRRALKQLAASRQVFISYGHHPAEVARFAVRLRDRLQADGIMCWMDEMKATGIQAGTEWREEIGRGLRTAKAVVFIASPHSVASDWCMLELSRARDLGKAVAPVWRLRSELDPRAAGLLSGLAFSDFTTDELFEAGYPAFLAGLRAALAAAGASDEAAEAGPEAVARALLARPGARCEPAGGPFCLVWCLPEDAPRAAPVLDAMALRGVRCFLDCSDGAPDAEASRALAACSALVPLLGPSSAASPALAARLKAAATRPVPVRPLVLSDIQVPFALEYSLARTRGFPLLAAGASDAALAPVLDSLLASAGPPAAAKPAPAPRADHSQVHSAATDPDPKPAAAPAAKAEAAASEAAAKREAAKLDAEHARLEARLRELEIAADTGPGAPPTAPPQAARAAAHAAPAAAPLRPQPRAQSRGDGSSSKAIRSEGKVGRGQQIRHSSGEMEDSRVYGFVGAGQMAAAIIRGLLKSTIIQADRIVASDGYEQALTPLRDSGIKTFRNGNQEVAKHSDVIVLAVKPDVIPDVLQDLRPCIEPARHLIVSIAAGVSIAQIERELPPGSRVVRVMPNTPCLVGECAAAFSLGSEATSHDKETVGVMFGTLGTAICVKEKLLDAVTGLSGSGPAYVFLMIEAMADGGVRAGLSRDVALKLAAQTVLGAAKMVLETGKHPGLLKDAVASPGGTTIAGIHELEKAGFRASLMNAVLAASQRSAELGKLG
eukprot:tig00021571_g22378.t1